MNTQDIERMFTYHMPFGDQAERYGLIRALARSMASLINQRCPDSREKSLAITHLQECVMMANASIAIHEVDGSQEVPGKRPRGGHLASMPEADQRPAESEPEDPPE